MCCSFTSPWMLLSAGFLTAASAADTVKTETTLRQTTQTQASVTTVITQTVTQEKQEWAPIRVCVLDFTTADIKGQERFLKERNRDIRVAPQNTLNAEDRKSVNSVMQGFVRMIDAWDSTRTNQANRNSQTSDNVFSRVKALALYNTVVKGQSRPTVLGADYLAAYLGKRPQVFSCVDAAQIGAAMQKLSQAPDFPKDFMLRLAKETGATHLIYGTVSDPRSKTTSFEGYGIKTKNDLYQLDVIIKVVDLVRQATVYGNVYTGSVQEAQRPGSSQKDNNLFQSLMISALEQAAEDLYDAAKPGRKNRISGSPLPWNITFQVSGGMFFKPESAEILLDGVRVGSGGDTVPVPAGRHRVEIKAPGYSAKSFDLTVSSDAKINTKLEK